MCPSVCLFLSRLFSLWFDNSKPNAIRVDLGIICDCLVAVVGRELCVYYWSPRCWNKTCDSSLFPKNAWKLDNKPQVQQSLRFHARQRSKGMDFRLEIFQRKSDFFLPILITALRYIYVVHCSRALHFLHWDLETKKSQRHLSSTKRERFFFSRPKVPRTAAVNK